MKAVLPALALLLFSAPALASEDPTYSEMVAEAQNDGLSVNYTALREAYALTTGADLEGLSLNKQVEPMIESAQAGDCDKALGISDQVLKSAFVNILAHMVRSECFDKKGELAKSAREDTIVSGLKDSIFGSGDGRSEKSAYVIVSLDEEEFVLSSLGLNGGTQALLHDGGHSYDLIQAADEKGLKSSVYFQIDAIEAAEDRAKP